MTKLEAIATAKQFRKDADELLQRMKRYMPELRAERRSRAIGFDFNTGTSDPDHDCLQEINEIIAQHELSIRDLESAIMRQGMVLKSIGNPDPYPESRNPDSPRVEPVADGLKM